jgi:cysteine desulfurase
MNCVAYQPSTLEAGRLTSMKQIYLDHAAATALDERVLQKMQPYFSQQFYNPSALYLPAQAVAKDLLEARAQVAHWLGARPSEIIFTAGATEANNIAIHGIMRDQPNANIVVSSIEHDSVLAPAASYVRRLAPVTSQGLIDLVALETLIDDQTMLISIMYANNEIGTVQPLRQVARLIGKIRLARQAVGDPRPLYLHTDAAQAANYLDLHVARLGVDLLTLNGGKMYGPKQSGVLYIKAGLQLAPWLTGGGQERGLRSGTENIAGCIGLAAALEIAQSDRHDETIRLQRLQRTTFERLLQKIPSLQINGSRRNRLPNNIHITLPGSDNERLLVQLEEKGVLAAAGSACSASSEEPSHVLKAIGLTDSQAQASLRFSMGRGTTEPMMAQLVNNLSDLYTS